MPGLKAVPDDPRKAQTLLRASHIIIVLTLALLIVVALASTFAPLFTAN
ncbi:hypothetical protein [Paramesorhizobium deserti]|nr:hypothetical protein [Paramesorhizobium deserti]